MCRTKDRKPRTGKAAADAVDEMPGTVRAVYRAEGMAEKVLGGGVETGLCTDTGGNRIGYRKNAYVSGNRCEGLGS